MKRIFVGFFLSCLLLAGCAEKPAPALTGTWVNAGQYSEGRDFVETMTLTEEGGVLVKLEYQGSPYASLEGVWSLEGNVLTVDFADTEAKDRVYTCALTETTLTLTGNGKEVVYQRQN